MEAIFHIAACDDESVFLEQLSSVVEEILSGQRVEYRLDLFTTSSELFDALPSNEYHLILLDILMGKENGLDCAKRLRELGEEADLVFITVSPDFALPGYSVYPTSYLLKPISAATLRDPLLHCLADRDEGPSLLLPTLRGGMAAIAVNDILYVEVLGREITVHCRRSATPCHGTLDTIAASLPREQFYRCHRSYLVNMRFVDGLERYRYLLKGGESVPVAKNRFGEAQDRLVSAILR